MNPIRMVLPLWALSLGCDVTSVSYYPDSGRLGAIPYERVDAGISGTDDAGNGTGPTIGVEPENNNDGGVTAFEPAIPLPDLPLRTEGRWVVDSKNKRFKLASVNWYGAEQKDHVVSGLEIAKLSDIAKRIRLMGFNSVRLPWSNEMVEMNPVVADRAVAANPGLRGKRALEVFDAVVDALARQGLVIILANETSSADRCCAENDGNSFWYAPGYPESLWIAHWQALVRRYVEQPAVQGADLRNQPRPSVDKVQCPGCTKCPCAGCPANACRYPAWGNGEALTDWHAAAKKAGDAVLATNPNLLIVVQGLNYGTNLTGPFTLPLTLSVPNRLVYSAHDEASFHTGMLGYADLSKTLGESWGYLISPGKQYTAPVWVGSFGTCNTGASCLSGAAMPGLWYSTLRQYLSTGDFDWCYSDVNGTHATATGRTFGAKDPNGIFDTKWEQAASIPHLQSLQAIQPKTSGP